MLRVALKKLARKLVRKKVKKFAFDHCKQLSKEKQLSLEKMEEIMELCPDISKVTVERILTNLVKSGYIAKVGAGLSTGYVRI